MRDLAVLSSDVLTSSIWKLPNYMKVVWVTLLLLADDDGVVRENYDKISALSNVDEDRVRMSIDEFTSEDKTSRTKTNHGKRIAYCRDGLVVLNFGKYNKKTAKQPKVYLSHITVQALVYEWAKAYKTDIDDKRIRKELNHLGKEDPSKLILAFRNCLRDTPPKFFSWPKFADTWKIYLEEKVNVDQIFNLIASNPTGRSGVSGPFWTRESVVNLAGEAAAKAFDACGGSERFAKLNTQNRKFAEMDFKKGYGTT